MKENNNGADAIKRSSQGDASEESVSRGHDDEKPTGNEAIKDIFIDKHVSFNTPMVALIFLSVIFYL